MEVVHPGSYQRADRPRSRPASSARVAVTIGFLFLLSAMGLAALVFVGTHDGAIPASHTERLADVLAGARFDRSSGDDVRAIVASTSLGQDALKKMTPEAARLANERLADAGDVGPAASPFLVSLGNGRGYFRALECMTAAIYYEAANEPSDGQRAVAQVVLNRVRHFSYPKTVCGVVFQGANRKTGCQFSFTCDGSLLRQPSVSGWQRAHSVASAALAGAVYAPVGLATHYHADYVMPYWAPTLVRQKMIGRHIFYRWPGQWGKTASFIGAYAQVEPDVWSDAKRLAGDIAPLTDPLVQDAAAMAGLEMTARPVLPVGGTLHADALHPADSASGVNPQIRTLSASQGQPSGSSTVRAEPSRGSITGGVIMPGAGAPTPSSQADQDKVAK